MPVKIPATPEQIARNGHIAAILREQLAKRDWKAVDLNDALELEHKSSQTTQWLNSKGAPHRIEREKLAKLFGMPAETFEPRGLVNPNLKGGPPRRTNGQIPVANGGARHIDAPGRPPKPAAIPRPVQGSEVLSFQMSSDGTARIKLDAVLPLEDAQRVFALLMPLVKP